MDVDRCHLDGNADAVEFCPHSPFQHILAAATYTLEEGSQPHRSGSISLFSADAVAGLQLLHRAHTSGIFDIKWNPSGDGDGMHPLLARADADGCVSLLRLQLESATEDHGSLLREVCTERISSAMCLCVDWNPTAGSLSLGLSDGSASIVAVRESQLQTSQSWSAHEYELWAASFDTYRPHLLYTGSDDCCFSCWDLRESPSNLVFRNARSHKMGVCCIAQNPMNSNMLLTGSYDESIRLWDIRSISKPVNEKSLCLGGGVWRIKYHPYLSNLVLAACMHNGFAVVRIEEMDAIILETYSKHESLAYGADWQRGGVCLEDKSNRGSLVATCSFYDRLLRLWNPESIVVK